MLLFDVKNPAKKLHHGAVRRVVYEVKSAITKVKSEVNASS